jgi:hypothetical protein
MSPSPSVPPVGIPGLQYDATLTRLCWAGICNPQPRAAQAARGAVGNARSAAKARPCPNGNRAFPRSLQAGDWGLCRRRGVGGPCRRFVSGRFLRRDFCGILGSARHTQEDASPIDSLSVSNDVSAVWRARGARAPATTGPPRLQRRCAAAWPGARGHCPRHSGPHKRGRRH